MKYKLRTILLAVIFLHFFIPIGSSFCLAHNASLCFSTTISITIWLVKSLIYSYIFYCIIDVAINAINTYKPNKQTVCLNYKKLFKTTVGVQLLCFISFFPCLFDFGGALGLRTQLQSGEVTTNHQPYLLQLLHAAFYNIGGITFGNPSIGIAILTLLFIVTCSAIIITIKTYKQVVS